MKNYNRRNFVEKIGMGFLGLSFVSFNPLKLLAKEKVEKSNINIKINPIAVKRTNIKRF